jgi:DNA-directed RNA polymerase specialized sigma subunit
MGNNEGPLENAWRAFVRENSESAANDLAKQLAHLLKRITPHRSFGLNAHQLEEIRQDSLLLLVHRYLHGNPQLAALTENGSAAEIRNEILRSANAAVRGCTKSHVARCLRAERIQEHLEAEPAAKTIHPALAESLWELSVEIQREIIRDALDQAVRCGRLRPRAAEVPALMLDEDLTQSEVAARCGVSREAIHQRLQAVRAVLPDYIAKTEFVRS